MIFLVCQTKCFVILLSHVLVQSLAKANRFFPFCFLLYVAAVTDWLFIFIILFACVWLTKSRKINKTHLILWKMRRIIKDHDLKGF